MAYLLFPFVAAGLIRYRSRWISWVGVAVAYLALEVTWRLVYSDRFGGALARIGTEFLAGCFLFKLLARRFGAGAASSFDHGRDPHGRNLYDLVEILTLARQGRRALAADQSRHLTRSPELRI
jgi:peptidoglycan/LPS O-acetylase OafA/YrhL